MSDAAVESRDAIENLLSEDRTFDPPASFVERANVADPKVWETAAADPEAYWAAWARELEWSRPFTQGLDWSDAPFARWFADGQLNASVNCLDRHVERGLGQRVAFHWQGEDGERRSVTYAQLLEEVSRCANALRELGVQRGDRVAIYMPMVVELPVAMLACARIGAAHSVVFGGFSSQALADRIVDASAKVVITADGGYRRGKVVELKAATDEAVRMAATDGQQVESVLCYRRLQGHDTPWTDGRDHWWHEIVGRQQAECAPEAMDSEDLLFLLYTSGTTAKPKGIMHTTGGYLTGAHATANMVFDLKDDDVYWCAADIGWVTGHSYIVYGPLSNGVTSVIYEGAPDWPDKDRLWSIVAEYGVSIFYTAPTAIRAFIKWGDEHPARHDLSSLRLLGSVGEPINPEAWMWYHERIGAERCPIVDTWWQTETGHIMVSPLPGLTRTKPGSATQALPGIEVSVVDEQGEPVGRGHGGYLTIDRPWPGMARGIWGNPERFVETYWSQVPGRYFVGDGAKIDEDGYLWVLGRVDDVMNVSGHRLSTTEVESALVEHPAIAEAAVVGRSHELTGECVVAYVVLEGHHEASDELIGELNAHVSERIGKFARPHMVLFTPEVPKTRSGKIMRRLLRDIAEGRELGDTTTLQDPTVVDALAEQVRSRG